MTTVTKGASLLRSIDEMTMSRAQILVLCLSVLLAALDGYDVLATALAAPALTAAWGIDKGALGLLLSSGLIGMAIGALGLSPLADKWGRRPLVFGGLTLMVGGSLLSALCDNIQTLAACRVVTGMGIGVMVPLTMSISAEFCNARKRAFAVAITTVGFTCGSVIAGLVAAPLLTHFGWHAVFISGGVAGLVVLPIAFLVLPESPAYLLTRQPELALIKVNKVLAYLKHPLLTELPAKVETARPSYRSLFAPHIIGITVRLTLVFMLASTTTYFLINWLPQFIADAGFDAATASKVSAITHALGMIGAFALGMLATRLGSVRVAAAGLIGFGIFLGVFGMSPPILPLLIFTASAAGFCLSGATGVFYATMASAFPPLTRVTGIGFILGVGRVSSVLGPALAGWMFAAGLSRGQVSLFFAAAPILAGLILLTLPKAENGAAQPAEALSRT
ncbi:MFS transporter [Pseudomonas rustica]|jgi:benzoate transport|uniref:MFS transporter n=1 Tax=Pseudomonas rustica TaxID=2827099 RepID=UPI001BB06D5E|nr:MFS transporter [Pseudomonas rustica]MBS4089816.1 MFS transporter [Pseudomonas rustica]